MKNVKARVLSLGMYVACPILCIGSLGSCISQMKYDEALAQAKYYQSMAYDWEQYAQEVEAERDDLQNQMAVGQVATLQDAQFERDIESRMGNLQAMLEGLGRPPGDIERFDVEGGYIIMVQDKILFSSGSADISGEGRKAILGLAREIQQSPHGRIWIRGHTDADPVAKPATKKRFPHGNLQLSAARAIEVASLLSGEGRIPQRDVAVVGFGPNEPIKVNDSAENKRLNRRVEIFVANP